MWNETLSPVRREGVSDPDKHLIWDQAHNLKARSICKVREVRLIQIRLICIIGRLTGLEYKAWRGG
jgi:hypothetical protein